MSKQQSKTGFTIIEVVLVLAIAGLIFLMVFLALPALQRSQRDTQRRDDMARFSSQIAQYQTNNRGKVPNNTVKKGVWVETKTETEQNPTGSTGLGGTIPNSSTSSGDWTNFLNNYMWAANDTFTDPSGMNYIVQDMGYVPGASGATSTATASVDNITSVTQPDYTIYVWHGATCGTTEGKVEPADSGGARKLAFLYKLEGAGYYCGEI